MGGAGASGEQVKFLYQYTSLSDVQLVGRRKAIGYYAYANHYEPPCVIPVPEEELEAISEELISRGMEVYDDLSTEDRGHQSEIAELCKQLPPMLYCRKLRPSYHLTPWRVMESFAVDPGAIESLLLSNSGLLHGYPPTAEAFVDLVRSVWVEETNPLGQMITMAFSQRGLY